MAGQRKKASKGKSDTVANRTAKSGEGAKAKTAEKRGKEKKVSSAEKSSSPPVKTASIVVKPTKEASSKVKSATAGSSFAEALRWVPGTSLAEIDASSTPAWNGSRAAAEGVMSESAQELSEWQEKLFAAARGGSQAAVLLVVQGMDTSGKGGVLRHVVGQCDPQGIALTSFKAPTEEERSHPFLWRIRAALPSPGKLGVFDRSHYEDVLIARVQNLAPRATIARRYTQIVTFEKGLVRAGIVPIKVMLHISPDEQAVRLQERIERPDKHWKYNPGDIDQRLRWGQYQEAYEIALDKTSTDEAPWFVVPANRKWYARLAVQSLLLEHLRVMHPEWPSADFSVAEELERLRASTAAIGAQA